ncbi:eukaryotic initiation factor-2 beta, putative [Toxoplasma gondii ME49]|uniref:Eukaryotic initiation factor-2 beta, putative n=16 Tax=Toxoplasma gondii TaxID=5811 RepID=A0A125YH36_TOXGM|nr:eukaryotic initiation factor-2 beta, putative [Toxoplasma gondii ME49]EPR60348.1 putative eukaryotic initiation factor-2 beta [Toxoplasma gondii GT1]ESS30906.1 putative eukaryotic initiation factor-2 beta [Toxoplasma gondii VEG]KAF4640270.1 putative eukaryotic initiation factor-2 beta [Toxoplasma gondii]KFG31547.1 putative eukaryotic initiation factor-2 beta [Toxoplasma gondii GAB2-2007-GAL-DOM2]KFG37213.1 putative eukaryotic initiation factor-2 beta [Toxoplasma gondii p89]KFH00272.1 putat|eukprot:XP_002368949.1 eukaryotic initiation factor-2 beta, putative [Toxoplasma gondii ME49]
MAEVEKREEAAASEPQVEAEAKQPEGEEEAPQQFDFGERRRRKKKEKKETEQAQEEAPIIDGTGELFKRGKEYSYQEMLQRIQTLIEKHNPDLSGAKRYTIKPPQVVRVGSKKVAWINFKDICNIMNRQPDHVHQFVLAELGTEGSIAGDGQLVLKGKYGPKHIEALLRKYITEYVTCQMCKSPNTTMQRDSRTRLWQQSCVACGANRSVTTIKSGFHAVGKGERRKAKLG